MAMKNPVPGTNGDQYIPYAARTGEASTVYFTLDLSAEGLRRIFSRISSNLTGKVGIKLHTGEPHGPNIIPRPWVEALVKNDLPGANIVETNTYYEGDRYTTEQHRKTLAVNGWTFCPVDIMDEGGTVVLPVQGGKWFDGMHMGKILLIMIPCLCSRILKGTQWAVSAAQTRISASAARMAESARRRSIRYLAPTTCGALHRKN